MTGELVVLGVILAVQLAGALVWQLGPRVWLRRRVGRRVIVHCLPPSDQSVEGLLHHYHRDGLVLVGARFLEANAPAAGEVFVPRDRVAFVQYQPPGV